MAEFFDFAPFIKLVTVNEVINGAFLKMYISTNQQYALIKRLKIFKCLN